VEYGTIKSEVRAQYEGVSQDYYHYEVITRWWKTETGFEWKHTVISVDRDGTITRLEDMGPSRVIKEYVSEYIAGQTLSKEHALGVFGRGSLSEQHAYIVRLVLG
jgi:hypothetical protein